MEVCMCGCLSRVPVHPHAADFQPGVRRAGSHITCALESDLGFKANADGNTHVPMSW